MTKFYAYTIGLCAALSMASCTKEEADQVAPKPNLTAKEAMLTAKNWRITALTISSETTIEGIPFTSTSDGYARLADCRKDSFMKFNSNKTGVSDEGATKCSATDPQTQSFEWSLNADETELSVSGVFNGATQAQKIELLQLTSTTMQVRTTSVTTQYGITSVAKATTTYTAF